MPELPEIAVFKKYIDQHCLNRKILKVKVDDRLLLKGISSQGFGRKVKGRKLVSSERYGKYLFLKIEDEGFVMFHFGLTGSIEFYNEKEEKPKYAKILIQFEDKNILAYSSRRKLGYVKYVGDKQSYITSKKLGPDALTITKDEFERLAKSHRGAVKPFLMNQKIIAGIGNEYSDEILFQSKVHPLSKIENLDIDNLYRNLKNVLTSAVKIKTGEKEFPSNWLISNRNDGDKCPGCNGKISKIIIGGRAAYFCPECQMRY